MKRFALRCAIALVTFFIGVTTTGLRHVYHFDTALSHDAAEQAVLGVEREYVRAHLERDVPALDRVLADDFSSFGGRVKKEHRLAMLANPYFTINSLDTSDISVKVNGDEAWVGGKAKMTGRYKDREFASPPYEFTRRFVKRQGHWQIVNIRFAIGWR